MTEIEEIFQRIKEIGENFIESLNECQKALAELKESKKEGKWKPNKDEWYWFVTQYGEVKRLHWQDTECYEYLYSRQPIFETKEECERYKLFMDIVKEKSYEFSRDDFENDNFSKYMIAYDFGLKNFYVDCVLNRKYFGEIYFKDEEDAEYIINNFKEELLEYWL